MKVKTKMKKLLLMVTAVMFAVGVQAAVAVTWQTGTGVKDVKGQSFTTSTSGYTASVMYSTAADMSAPISVGGTTTATAYKTKGSAGFGGTTGEAFETGTPYYVQITITEDATGKTWKSGIGSFTIPDGSLAGPTVNFTSGANLGGSSLIGSTTYSGGSGGVPEPTSGLLLALGGAMLALRRKRR